MATRFRASARRKHFGCRALRDSSPASPALPLRPSILLFPTPALPLSGAGARRAPRVRPRRGFAPLRRAKPRPRHVRASRLEERRLYRANGDSERTATQQLGWSHGSGEGRECASRETFCSCSIRGGSTVSRLTAESLEANGGINLATQPAFWWTGRVGLACSGGSLVTRHGDTLSALAAREARAYSSARPARGAASAGQTSTTS